MKKFLSIILCLTMVFGVMAAGGEGVADIFDAVSLKASAETYSVGDHIEYGNYPQTDVTESMGSTLNSLTLNWKSYGYYSHTGSNSDGQTAASDYMRYADVTYGGNKYRAVTFDSYRPRETGYTSSADYSYQDDNGYEPGNVYWFRYDPIQWRVLDPDTGLILCETLIDSQAYNNYCFYPYAGYYGGYCYGDSNKTYYANNYAESSIREWLNDDFYNTAFSSNQKSNILTTALDNSAYGTLYSEYNSATTNDKVFLLSYRDAFNSSYGFSKYSNGCDTARRAQGSDYAKCQGLEVSTDSEYSGNSYWRLRSAGDESDEACVVHISGCIYASYNDFTYLTYDTYLGVRPALHLQNLKSDYAGSETDVSCDFNQEFSIGNDTGVVNIKFSQAWFNEDSINYNHELCQFTSKIAMIAYASKDNYQALHQALAGCGFGADVDESFTTGIDEVNYFIADQEIELLDGKKYNLVFAGFIGTNGDQWETDFDTGYNSNGTPKLLHEGFEKAAAYAYAKVSMYLSNHNFDKDKTILLFTGHSRGAAVANIVSSWFINYEPRVQRAPVEKIYTYTFATPNVTTDPNKYDSDYCRIFNIINPEDLVTKFAPVTWKYGRYGRSFTLPSKTNCKDYSSLKDSMQSNFYGVFTGGKEYYPYEGGEDTVWKIMGSLASSITSDYDYCARKFKFAFVNGDAFLSLRDFMRAFVAPVMKDGSLQNISNLKQAILAGDSEFKSILSPVLDIALSDGISVIANAFPPSHEMQTYCAWVCSLTKDQLYKNHKYEYGTCYGEYGCYKGIANCPVDIEIYNKDTNQLVGRIKDNAVDTEIASKDYSVVMCVNGESKSFWLPKDGNYTIKLIGNDNGTMDYTLEEIDSDVGEIGRVNSFNVPIEKSKSWSGETISESYEIDDHTLTSENGEVLVKTEDRDEAAKKYSINLTAEGNGGVSSSLSVLSGEYVTIQATPDEGNSFAGWYENDELVSSEETYSFVAKSNRTFIAKFKATGSEEPSNPDKPDFSSFKIKNYNSTLPVDYKSTIIFHTTMEAPEGYEIVWSNGDKGSECKLNRVTDKEYKVSAKMVEKSTGKTSATSQEVTVKVNTGFFAKIIAFFRSLFGSLPIYEDFKRK